MTKNTNAATVVASAKEAVIAAEAELTASEAAYVDRLTVAEFDELERLAQRKMSAQVAVDRSRAVLEAAEIREAAAAEADQEAARRERYDAARKLAEAAEKKMRKEYGKHAAAIRDLLRELASAASAVHEANEDLPEGATPLAGPEASRSQPNLYTEILSEEVVERWAAIGDASPLPEDRQSSVQRVNRRRRLQRHDGELVVDDAPLVEGIFRTDRGQMECALKRFRRREFLPDQSGRYVPSLATEIALPPLDAGADPFWRPTSDGSHAALTAAAQSLRPQPVRSEREPEVTYTLIGN